MGEAVEQSGARGLVGLLVACALAGMSVFIGLAHSTAGFINPVEAVLIGPPVAGYILGGLITLVTGGDMGFLLVCVACVSVLGWYALLVWLFIPERRLRRDQKMFWAIVTLLTWIPAVALTVVVCVGVPVGSSM